MLPPLLNHASFYSSALEERTDIPPACLPATLILLLAGRLIILIAHPDDSYYIRNKRRCMALHCASLLSNVTLAFSL